MRRRLQPPRQVAQPELAPSRAAEPAGTLLRLQRSHGNRAVGQLLLQRQPKADVKPADLVEELGQHLAKGKRQAVLDKLRLLSPDDLTAVDAARGSLKKDHAALLHRCVSFVRWAPVAEKPHPSDVTVKKEGTTQGLDPAKVPGGTVEVRTAVDYYWKKASETKTGGVSLNYTGADAPNTRWLQFIWRGIWVERKPLTARGKPRIKPVEGTISRGNGTYPLTTDRDKPDWNTDASAGTPYFEVNGSVNRSDKEVTLYDPPDHRNDKAQAEFSDDRDPPTRGTSIAHLTDYLVRDMDVLFRVDIEIDWELTPPDKKGDLPKVSGPRFSKPVVKKVSALDPEHRKRVISQNPALELEWLP